MLIDRRAILSIYAMAVLATLPVAGCGGKSSSGPTATDASSSRLAGADAAAKKQFVARADPICRRFNVQLVRSRAKGKGKGRERAAYVGALRRSEAIEQRAIDELTSLTPPTALVADWNEMLADRRLLATQLGELATALERKNKVSEQELISRKKEWHQALRRRAVKNGFNDCAKVG